MRSIALFVLGMGLTLAAWAWLDEAPKKRGVRSRPETGLPTERESTPVDSRPAKRSDSAQTAVRSGPSVRAVTSAIRESYARRDWTAFRSGLVELGAIGTPESHAALVEILADRSVHFRPGSVLAPQFAMWLRAARTPGIPAAARWRCEEYLSFGSSAATGVQGWFDLIAIHAGADDIAWLADRDESAQVRNAAQRALVCAGRDEADQVLIGMIRHRKLNADFLGHVASTDPTRAIQFLERAMQVVGSMEAAHDWGPAVVTRYATLVRDTNPDIQRWSEAESTAREAYGGYGVMLVLHARVRSNGTDATLLERAHQVTIDALGSIARRAPRAPMESAERVHLYSLVRRIIATVKATPALQTRVMADALRTTGLAFTAAESPYHSCQRAAQAILASTD